MTISLVTYKLSSSPQKEINQGFSPSTKETAIEKNTSTTGRNDISQTVSPTKTISKFVYLGDKPFILINDRDLIALPTNVYSGSRNNIYELNTNPLIIYYQYEVSGGNIYSYLYQAQKDSSRTLGNLLLIGQVNNTYLFSFKKKGGFQGLSALYQGELQTLYTGHYTSVEYLGNIVRLTTNEHIYLPIQIPGF